MGQPTNYPFGLTSYGVPVIGSGNIPVANNYWFVSSVTGLAGNPGTSYNLAFATIGAATAVAANGDCIVLLEQHAETIAAAGGVTVSAAGITIVGLGSGATRPTFTFSTSTAATFLISGASCTVSNIVGVCAIDVLVSPFSITGANCTFGLHGAPVEWQDPSSSFQAIRAVLTSATADNLIMNLNYRGVTSGGTSPVNVVRLVGCGTGILNCDFYGRSSTAMVEFVTTACSAVEIYGYMYNSGVTNYTKDVVDTVTGSTWFANFNDGAAGIGISGGSGSALGPVAAATVIADLAVGTADATTNALERDVIGNKTDAAVTAVGTTKSLAAYAKGHTTMLTVIGADSTNNAFAGDVVGNKTDASVYVAGTANSVAAYVKGHAALQERVATSATAALGNGTVLFTVTGGPIKIESLHSECMTAQGASATTLQYSVTPTAGSAQTISNASASLTGAQAGATVTLAGTALATAALFNNNGPNLIANPGTILCPAGTITSVVTNATTGTWRHIIRYKPLTVGVTVA